MTKSDSWTRTRESNRPIITFQRPWVKIHRRRQTRCPTPEFKHAMHEKPWFSNTFELGSRYTESVELHRIYTAFPASPFQRSPKTLGRGNRWSFASCLIAGRAHNKAFSRKPDVIVSASSHACQAPSPCSVTITVHFLFCQCHLLNYYHLL